MRRSKLAMTALFAAVAGMTLDDGLQRLRAEKAERDRADAEKIEAAKDKRAKKAAKRARVAARKGEQS